MVVGILAQAGRAERQCMSRVCNFFVSGWRYVHRHRLPFTFSALRQPCAEAFREPLGRHAKTGLDSSLGDRQRVVKFRGVGKVAHAELIEPLQRAGAPLPANYDVHFEFLRVHAAIISLTQATSFRPACSQPDLRRALGGFQRPRSTGGQPTPLLLILHGAWPQVSTR